MKDYKTSEAVSIALMLFGIPAFVGFITGIGIGWIIWG